jgi:hypothetical protein
VSDDLDDKRAKRRVVGMALGASAFLMLMVALLVYTDVIEVSDQARTLVSGVLGVIALLDVMMAIYFFVSDPS